MAGEIVLGYDGQDGSVAALRTAVGDCGGVPAAARDRVRIPTRGDRRRRLRPREGSAWGRRGPDRGGGRRRLTRSTPRSTCRSSWSICGRRRRFSARPTSTTRSAIVVGTTGHGPIKGALLGSVTYQVVHRSTRPVVVVPAPEAT